VRGRPHTTLLNALATMLRPLVRLLLRCGIGYSEFNYVAKSVFIDVATREYGLRGRPTNTSRVSAITGISRKQIGKLRVEGRLARWTPNMEATPLSTILHYWHHDPEFHSAPGKPRPLSSEGPGSFGALVTRYGGDIPAGAIRASLIRAGTASENEDGLLVARNRYLLPTGFDDDYVRGMAFSYSNLGDTIAHNANLRQQNHLTREERLQRSRLQRMVWSEHMDEENNARFKTWIYERAEALLQEADRWIGERELPRKAWDSRSARTIGLGLFYFEEDSQDKVGQTGKITRKKGSRRI
jgi:Family of unknown function (DUF6502)